MLSAHPPVPLESIQFVQDSSGSNRRLSLTTATGHVLQTQRGVHGGVATPGNLSPLPGTPEEGGSPEGSVVGGAGARSGESTPDFGGFGQGTQLEEKDFEEHARGRSVSLRGMFVYGAREG